MEDILVYRNVNKTPVVQILVFEIKSEIKFFAFVSLQLNLY